MDYRKEYRLYAPQSPQELRDRLETITDQENGFTDQPFRGQIQSQSFRVRDVFQEDVILAGRFEALGAGSEIRIEGEYNSTDSNAHFMSRFLLPYVAIMGAMFAAATAFSQTSRVMFVLTLIFAFIIVLFYRRNQLQNAEPDSTVKDLAAYLEASIESTYTVPPLPQR